VQRAEGDAREDDGGDEDEKNRSSEAGCGFEIVGAPAESFGCVAMQNETRQKPNRKDEPSVKTGGLTAPDVKKNDGGKGHGFEEIRERRDERTRRLHT